MTADVVRVSERWLALREPADAAARARDLVEELVRHLPAVRHWVIHDLGSGTGAMGRWLAPLLTGPQRWVLHDRDPELLQAATADLPGPACDGATVTVETVQSDISQLHSDDLADATLITASALLDMLTAEELAELASVCVTTGGPALLTMSVLGRIELNAPERLDGRIAAAFNAHQRRMIKRGRLLGPDAPDVAVEKFGRLGARVLVRPSRWRLGASHADLAVEWFDGWVGAACEQEPKLADQAAAYIRRRRAQATAGKLAVTVHHADLLVLPHKPSLGKIYPADSGTSSVCAPLAAFVLR